MDDSHDQAKAFIARWGPSGGGERSNYVMFLTELCDLLQVARPDVGVETLSDNAYVFERRVPAKRVEGEAYESLALERITVDQNQFLGLEINPQHPVANASCCGDSVNRHELTICSFKE